MAFDPSAIGATGWPLRASFGRARHASISSSRSRWLEEARRLLQRLEHLAAGLVRLARLAQQAGQAVMDLGRVGVVEQRQGAVGGRPPRRARPVARGAGELAVRGRDQRIDRQEAASVPGQRPASRRPPRPSPSAAGRPGSASPSLVASSSRTLRSAAGSAVACRRRPAARRRSPARHIPGRVPSAFQDVLAPAAHFPRPRAAPPAASLAPEALGVLLEPASTAAESRRPAVRAPPRSLRGDALGPLARKLAQTLDLI